MSRAELKSADRLVYSTKLADLKRCNVFIVTVPTPIDDYKRPDLTPLVKASETVGQVLRKGAVVIYESTVYPGCTEEVCVPILERVSGLKFNEDFFAGYSPERINPGDKEHRLPTIKKVTSGSTPEVAAFVDCALPQHRHGRYAQGLEHPGRRGRQGHREHAARRQHRADQRARAHLQPAWASTPQEVLEAAGSKWNFLPFRPGLVGGHCIGVDPYYLTHKAQEIGYHPEMILAGRRINDNMGTYVATEILKLMTSKKIHAKDARVLVLGLTFKENCPDLRNSKVVDVIHELEKFGAKVDVHDPWVDSAEARHEYGIRPIRALKPRHYDAIVMAVAHREFKEMGIAKIRRLAKRHHVLYDIKHVFTRAEVDGRL